MKSEYPRANITADIIVYDRRGDRILLIKRANEPFKGMWAIPGGFFNSEAHHDEIQDVSLRAAAARELKEETGIDIYDPNLKTTFSFLTIQDAPGRDPRGRTISIVYVLTLWDMQFVSPKAQSDATEIRWFSLRELVDNQISLAFDHHDQIFKFARGITYI